MFRNYFLLFCISGYITGSSILIESDHCACGRGYGYPAPIIHPHVDGLFGPFLAFPVGDYSKPSDCVDGQAILVNIGAWFLVLLAACRFIHWLRARPFAQAGVGAPHGTLK